MKKIIRDFQFLVVVLLLCCCCHHHIAHATVIGYLFFGSPSVVQCRVCQFTPGNEKSEISSFLWPAVLLLCCHCNRADHRHWLFILWVTMCSSVTAPQSEMSSLSWLCFLLLCCHCHIISHTTVIAGYLFFGSPSVVQLPRLRQ